MTDMKSFPKSDNTATSGRMQKPTLRKTAQSKRPRDPKRPGLQSTVVHSTIGSRIEKLSRFIPKDQPRHTSGGTIRVHVTNRLGIKQEILCSPNDTIGQLKILVAVQLGLGPETILLKRQGQRPLKDFMTLQEYEIGSGSSLDLEMDTEE